MQFLELTMRGVLSFGPDTPPFPLRPLNVLIGPNGSGKSNLIEVIGLFRAITKGLDRKPVNDLFWKGETEGPSVAILESTIEIHESFLFDDPIALHHSFSITDYKGRITLLDEGIKSFDKPPHASPVQAFYLSETGGPLILIGIDRVGRQLFRDKTISASKSVLLQRKDPIHYPEITLLGEYYSKIRIYREWSFGRNSIFRTPQPADMPHDQLEEDFSNLGLFLNHLKSKPAVKKLVIEHLRDLYEGLDDFDVRVVGGTVELFLTEGDFVIPAGRLSDGTLRYLCLLAILCDPSPPPLICIEEPELGLHPDLLPKIADLLVAASERTQLIVTTHSDILVDALSEQPESVVVFEKHEGKTEFRRLKANEELKNWLKAYRLGQLWSRGQLGGNRW